MNTGARQSWVIGACILLGCLILGLFLGQGEAAPKKKAEAGKAGSGRFQFAVSSTKEDVYVFDSETGQLWKRVFSTKKGDYVWEDMVSPVKAKK
jgi:hypothetical protein